MDKITSTDFVGKWRSEGLGAARFNFRFYSYFREMEIFTLRSSVWPMPVYHSSSRR